MQPNCCVVPKKKKKVKYDATAWCWKAISEEISTVIVPLAYTRIPPSTQVKRQSAHPKHVDHHHSDSASTAKQRSTAEGYGALCR